ncbi:MAG: 30S ribosomal protein S8 [Patescibacteria group bacterium]
MHDPIADMLIRMKNAGNAGRTLVSFPYSKIKFAISELLEKVGYIKTLSKKGKKTPKSIDIELVFEKERAKIQGVKRVSKFSRRVYRQAREIRSVKQGHGIAVFSTPQGLLTDREARTKKIGGEFLFELW